MQPNPTTRKRAPRRPPVERVCETCGTTFTVWQSNLKDESKGRFCSLTCFQTTRLTGEHRACEQCAAPFYARAEKIKRGGGRFCSRLCASTSQRHDLSERLSAHTEILDNGCWRWTSNLLWSGYGYLTVRNRKTGTHRAAWEAATGAPVPIGRFILHTCDEHYAPGDVSYRACIRNDEEGVYEVGGVLYPRRGHLYLADHQANMLDRTRKGRGASGARHYLVKHPEAVLRGEANPFARLTENDVRQIRALYAKGGVSQSSLGQRFGIDQTVVSKIILRKAWNHVD